MHNDFCTRHSHTPGLPLLAREAVDKSMLPSKAEQFGCLMLRARHLFCGRSAESRGWHSQPEALSEAWHEACAEAAAPLSVVDAYGDLIDFDNVKASLWHATPYSKNSLAWLFMKFTSSHSFAEVDEYEEEYGIWGSSSDIGQFPSLPA